MAVIVAAKALLYSASTIVELADVDLSVLHHPSVDDSIGHFKVCEFYHH